MSAGNPTNVPVEMAAPVRSNTQSSPVPPQAGQGQQIIYEAPSGQTSFPAPIFTTLPEVAAPHPAPILSPPPPSQTPGAASTTNPTQPLIYGGSTGGYHVPPSDFKDQHSNVAPQKQFAGNYAQQTENPAPPYAAGTYHQPPPGAHGPQQQYQLYPQYPQYQQFPQYGHDPQQSAQLLPAAAVVTEKGGKPRRKKKTIIIIAVILALIVIVCVGVGVGLGLKKKNKISSNRGNRDYTNCGGTVKICQYVTCDKYGYPDFTGTEICSFGLCDLSGTPDWTMICTYIDCPCYGLGGY